MECVKFRSYAVIRIYLGVLKSCLSVVALEFSISLMSQIPTTWLLWLIWKLSWQVVDFLPLSCFETMQNFHQCEALFFFPCFDFNVLEFNGHLGMRSIRLNPASFPHFINFSKITQTNALLFQFISFEKGAPLNSPLEFPCWFRILFT